MREAQLPIVRYRAVRQHEYARDPLAVLKLFEAEPERCLQFARLLALRLRDLRSMHEIVRMKKAEDRVLHWLRLNAEGTPPVVPLRKSWSRIAEDLALTRESLYRTVAVLRKAGKVIVTNESAWVISSR